MKIERQNDFRQALWYLEKNLIPNVDLQLQPSIMSISRLLSNYWLNPEESEKIFHDQRKIWFNEPMHLDPRVNLLTYCLWKLKLYLTFEKNDDQDSAYQLFRNLIQILKSGEIRKEDLEGVCLPNSEKFPLPQIPREDLNFLDMLTLTCCQNKGSVTLKSLAAKATLPKQDVINLLVKLEIFFDCLVATEALGLYRIKIMINLKSLKGILQLIEKFISFALRIELHYPKKVEEGHRLIVEFYYPINQTSNLLQWSMENKVKVFRIIEHHLYQNHNIFYRSNWHGKRSTKSPNSNLTSIIYQKDKIKLTKEIIEIISAYTSPVTYGKMRIKGTMSDLLPFSNLGSHLNLKENWVRKIISDLFKNRILVRYFHSTLLGFWLEFLVEGNELILHMEAQKFLYSQLEILQQFHSMIDENSLKSYYLYVPETTPEIQKIGFRPIKKLFTVSPHPPPVRVELFNFEKMEWIPPKLPKIIFF